MLASFFHRLPDQLISLQLWQLAASLHFVTLYTDLWVCWERKNYFKPSLWSHSWFDRLNNKIISCNPQLSTIITKCYTKPMLTSNFCAPHVTHTDPFWLTHLLSTDLATLGIPFQQSIHNSRSVFPVIPLLRLFWAYFLPHSCWPAHLALIIGQQCPPYAWTHSHRIWSHKLTITEKSLYTWAIHKILS